MKEKALIKETGEILDIKSKFQKMKLKIDIDNFPDYLKESLKGFEDDVWIKSDPDKYQIKNNEGSYYILSDGGKYQDDEVIVGLDNIREYKLKNIIE